jgi:hypothetical protein
MTLADVQREISTNWFAGLYALSTSSYVFGGITSDQDDEGIC